MQILISLLVFGVSILATFAQNTTPVYFKTWETMGLEKPVIDLSVGEDQNLYGYIHHFIYRYDGNRWIRMVDALEVSSVYLATKQGIYLGGSGYLYWYKPDEKGVFDRVDLASKAIRNFEISVQPFEIRTTKSGVYFIGNGGIYKVKTAATNGVSNAHDIRDAGKLEHIWKTDTHAACGTTEALYIVDTEGQFVKFQHGKAQRLFNIAEKAANLLIANMNCLADGTVMMKSRDQQILRYAPASGVQLLRIKDVLPNVAIKRFFPLSAGRFAFLLGDAQILITDGDGQTLQKWNEKSLNLNSSVTNILTDAQDRVWFSNTEGIGYLDLPSQLQVIKQADPIQSTFLYTLQDEVNAYIVSQGSVLRRSLQDAWDKPYEPIFTSPNTEITGGAIGSDSGDHTRFWICEKYQLVHLRNGAKTVVNSSIPCESVGALKVAPDRVWVSNEDRFCMLDTKGNLLSSLKMSVGDIHVISEDELLIEAYEGNVDKYIKLKYDAHGNIRSTTHYPERNIQFDGGEHIFKYNDKVFRSDEEGVFRLELDKWVLATELWQPNPQVSLKKIYLAPDGKLWLIAEDRTGYFTVENGQYIWHGLPYRLGKLNEAKILLSLPDGSLVMRSLSGLVARVLPEGMKKPAASIAVEVSAVLHQDTREALYLGTKAGLPPSWRFETEVRGLLFYFGHREGADAGIQYQTWLEGEESDWSVWSKESARQYSNLSGSYTLHVRMRDSYGRIAETTFPFYVYPPWYARWWALVLWALLLGFGGYYGFQYAVQYRTKQFEAKNRELEAKVAERTQVIARQTEELRSLDQAKTLFFGNVSHEFRTPLTLLLAWIQRLKKERPHLDSAEGSEALYQMQSQVKNLQGLINQIMDLTKIEAGRFDLKKEALDMAAFTKRFTGTFQSLADYKQLKLVIEAPHAPIPVWASMTALEQILGNLLNNAIKFTEAGGEIKVQLQTQPDKTLSLAVTDTGFGISPQDLPHIFERFYQAKDDRNKQGGGTGIGLALASDLVKLHAGTLSAASELGKGSTFTLVLPIMENAPEVLATPLQETLDSRLPMLSSLNTVSQADPNEDRARLLIIEDQPDLRAFVRQMFETEYVVFEAENGETGLEMAKSVLPDLVLCDVMMPKMNGFEVAEALQQNFETKGIPFLFLTARAAEEDMLHGLSLGAVDYILKPFDTEALQLKVRNLLEVVRRDSLSKVPETAATQAKIEAPTETPFQIHVRRYVLGHLANPNLTVDDLVVQLNLGRSVFYQQFKEEFGVSPVVYIRALRMETALAFLQKGGLTISEIAYQVGFNSVAYFTKTFREKYGKPPSAFLK